MPCNSATFGGTNESNRKWTNWNGDVAFKASQYLEPWSTAQNGSRGDWRPRPHETRLDAPTASSQQQILGRV
jgi:hypothetical protein